MRNPYIIAPTRSIGDYYCRLLGIPSKQITTNAEHLRGFDERVCFILCTGCPWELKRRIEIDKALQVCDYTVIYLPEVKRVFC